MTCIILDDITIHNPQEAFTCMVIANVMMDSSLNNLPKIFTRSRIILKLKFGLLYHTSHAGWHIVLTK